MRRVVELILLVVAGFGGYRAWETGRERSRLEAVDDRLTREVGGLPVGDPAKALFRAQETDGPLHFAWLVHLPPNYPVHLVHSSGGFGPGTPPAKAQDFLARFQVREEGGRLQACMFVKDGSMKFSIGDRPLADLLRSHPGVLLVERPGVAGTAAFDRDQPVPLLRLTFPESMREAATKAYPGHFEGGKPLVLFEMTLNPGPRKP